MRACRTHHEALILDATGELKEENLRQRWEAHAAACPICRAERDRLVSLLGKMRAAAAVPELSGAEAHFMAERVRRNLLFPKPARTNKVWLPRLAAAAVVLLLVAAAAVQFLPERLPGSERTADLRIEDRVPAQDLEVIRQLDFLRNFETIEKLVHAVDLPPAPDARPGGEDLAPSQGARSREHAFGYV